MKKLSLELGGHAPLLVFEDADLDVAVAGAAFSKFRHSGQACICTNRVIVHTSIYDEFDERFGKTVAKLTLGNGFEPNVDVEPLINTSAVEKMEKHVTDAVSKGAKILAGGKRSDLGECFYVPTAIADVTSDMLITSEETFGPVAAAMAIEAFLSALVPKAPFTHSKSAIEDLKMQVPLLARAYKGKMGKVLREIIAIGQTNDETRKLLVSGYLNPRRSEVKEILQRGIELGELRKDLDLDVVVDAIYGPLFHRLLSGHAPLNERFALAIVETVLQGLAAHPEN